METESIDNFFHLIRTISSYLFYVGFIGMLAHIFKKGIVEFSGTKISLGLIAVAASFITGLTAIISSEIVQLHALKKVKYILNEPVAELKINGKEIDSINRRLVLYELRRMNKKMAHGSHTVNNIVLEVYTQRDTLKLEIGRDSQIENEYWIFWDRYHSTAKNEFARVRTELFENIK